MTTSASKAIDSLRAAVLRHDAAGLTDAELLGRFVRQRDDAALAALVRRHGPMVWGVCRRLLPRHHDAEDAFQATFLVLVRKAVAVVPRAMLANWLYGVAYRTALQARRSIARRKAHEEQTTSMPERAVTDPDLWPDLRPILDGELGRLPDDYRAVVILCDIEGKTRREAARELGCPEGTVAGRLARARSILAKRLARHGPAVPAAALAAVLTERATGSVPEALAASTITGATAGLASARVVALTEGVLKAMLISKLKTGAIVSVIATILIAGGSSLTWPVNEAKALPTPDDKPGTTAPAKARPQVSLEGGWMLVAKEENGQKREFPQGNGVELFIDGEHMHVYTESEGAFGGMKTGNYFKYPYRTQPARAGKPAEIDLVSDDRARFWQRGIFKLDGERLTICWGGQDRPTEFRTKAGTPGAMVEFKRKERPKAAAPAPVIPGASGPQRPIGPVGGGNPFDPFGPGGPPVAGPAGPTGSGPAIVTPEEVFRDVLVGIVVRLDFVVGATSMERPTVLEAVIRPESTTDGNRSVTRLQVRLSEQVESRLNELGIDDVRVHFYRKRVRVMGRLARDINRGGAGHPLITYTMVVDKLEQIESVGKK